MLRRYAGTFARAVALSVVAISQIAVVAAAETAWPVPEWQTVEPVAAGMNADKLAKVGELLKASGAKTGMVVRGGKIVAEWYFDGADRNTKLLVYSSSKSFASTAAGLAIADGKLSLDTKVGELLPDVKPAGKREVTVRQIISMDTGVHNNADLAKVEKRFSYALYEAPMDFEPGKKWDYNNTGLALLGPVLKKATGKQVDEILDEKVFRRIGIGQSHWSWDKNEEMSLPYSGLHITARGFARFGLLFLRGGKWQDEQVVPAAWVKEATGPSQEMNPEYGYLWWNNSKGKKFPGCPADTYAALGRAQNNMLIVPSLDLIVIRQIGDDPMATRKFDMNAIYQAACAAVEK
jgi:CubicO group peptidase (beta-lactamase class C family)